MHTAQIAAFTADIDQASDADLYAFLLNTEDGQEQEIAYDLLTGRMGLAALDAKLEAEGGGPGPCGGLSRLDGNPIRSHALPMQLIRFLFLSLTVIFLGACGGDSRTGRTPGTNNNSRPVHMDCGLCIDMRANRACYPGIFPCTPGEGPECWDGLKTCTSSQSMAEASCWRNCSKNDQWPDAPFPDTADTALCKGDCDEILIECLKTAASATTAQECSVDGGACTVICEQ